MDWGTSFNIAHIETHSHIYGPGSRFVIWVQGCSLACTGCWNKQMWSFSEKSLRERESLLEEILETKGIQGVTILGGEPLQQSNNVIWLLEHIRKNSKLTSILYTGYSQDELKSMLIYEPLSSICDVLITGRYQEELRNVHLQWRGSTNQEILYTPDSRILAKPESKNEVEVIIDEDGSITVLGYPVDGFEKSITQRA